MENVNGEDNREYVIKERGVEDKIRQWVVPILFVIISWFLNDKMNDLRETIKVIFTVQLAQEGMRKEMDAMKDKINNNSAEIKDLKSFINKK